MDTPYPAEIHVVTRPERRRRARILIFLLAVAALVLVALVLGPTGASPDLPARHTAAVTAVKPPSAAPRPGPGTGITVAVGTARYACTVVPKARPVVTRKR